MNRYIIQALILWGAIGLIWFLFMYEKDPYVDREAEFKHRIDSLNIEIQAGKAKIASLDSANHVLDSLVIQDKAQLTEIAQKAEVYKQKYNEEHNRILDMSDDSIVSEFTAAFDYD